MPSIANVIVGIVCAWLLLGAIFAVPFVTRGVRQIDPLAREATRTFRLVIVPGVLVFWPLLAARWLSGARQPPIETNPHRRAAALAAGSQPRRIDP